MSLVFLWKTPKMYLVFWREGQHSKISVALWERTCRSRDSGACNSSSRTAIPGPERIQSTCSAHQLPGRCECMLKSCKDTWQQLSELSHNFVSPRVHLDEHYSDFVCTVNKVRVLKHCLCQFQLHHGVFMRRENPEGHFPPAFPKMRGDGPLDLM